MTSVNSILFRAAFGIPGAVTRVSAPTLIEPQAFGATAFPFYGLFGLLSANTFVPLNANSQPYGLLVRPFPTTGANASDPIGTSVPPTAGVANVLRKGFATVLNRGTGTPALGGTVYARYAAASGSLVLGGVESVNVAGDTVALTNAQFMGPADANGNVEISYGGPNQ